MAQKRASEICYNLDSQGGGGIRRLEIRLTSAPLTL
jgi:hypothetical protein